MSEEETRRTVELTEMFAVMPAFRSVYQEILYDYDDTINAEVTDPYISSPDNSMCQSALHEYLLEHRLLDCYMRKSPLAPLGLAPLSAGRRAA